MVAWGKLAETCKQYLIKGSLVYIEGRLQTRSWEDNEGKKHSRTELVANEMIILDRSKTAHATEHSPTETPESEDEFPF